MKHPAIASAKFAYTGGGTITIWGKLSNGLWYTTDTDGCISEFDVDTDKYMDRYLNDDGFDAYEYEREHVLRRYYPTEEMMSEMRRQLNTPETSAYLDVSASSFSGHFGEVFFDKEDEE